jgi:hypothetical protein
MLCFMTEKNYIKITANKFATCEFWEVVKRKFGA